MSEQITNTTNMQVLAKAEVLGCPIDAVFKKNGGTSKVVVYGKADPKNPQLKSLEDVANEFGDMIGQEDLGKALPGAVSNITISLNQVYYSKVGGTQGSKPTDCALWLELHADKLTEDWPIKVKSVSIKVWTTTNPKILEDMKITEMEKLIGSV